MEKASLLAKESKTKFAIEIEQTTPSSHSDPATACGFCEMYWSNADQELYNSFHYKDKFQLYISVAAMIFLLAINATCIIKTLTWNFEDSSQFAELIVLYILFGVALSVYILLILLRDFGCCHKQTQDEGNFNFRYSSFYALVLHLIELCVAVLMLYKTLFNNKKQNYACSRDFTNFDSIQNSVYTILFNSNVRSVLLIKIAYESIVSKYMLSICIQNIFAIAAIQSICYVRFGVFSYLELTSIILFFFVQIVISMRREFISKSIFMSLYHSKGDTIDKLYINTSNLDLGLINVEVSKMQDMPVYSVLDANRYFREISASSARKADAISCFEFKNYHLLGESISNVISKLDKAIVLAQSCFIYETLKKCFTDIYNKKYAISRKTETLSNILNEIENVVKLNSLSDEVSDIIYLGLYEINSSNFMISSKSLDEMQSSINNQFNIYYKRNPKYSYKENPLYNHALRKIQNLSSASQISYPTFILFLSKHSSLDESNSLIKLMKEEVEIQNKLISKVSHEFRTPCIAIQNIVETIRLSLKVISLDANSKHQQLTSPKNNNLSHMLDIEEEKNKTTTKSFQLATEKDRSNRQNVFEEGLLNLKKIKFLSEIVLLLISDLSEYFRTPINSNDSLASQRLKNNYTTSKFNMSCHLKMRTLKYYVKNLCLNLLEIYSKKNFYIIIHIENNLESKKIAIDDKKLKQILCNLISNAIKSTIQGGIEILIYINPDQVQNNTNTSNIYSTENLNNNNVLKLATFNTDRQVQQSLSLIHRVDQEVKIKLKSSGAKINNSPVKSKSKFIKTQTDNKVSSLIFKENPAENVRGFEAEDKLHTGDLGNFKEDKHTFFISIKDSGVGISDSIRDIINSQAILKPYGSNKTSSNKRHLNTITGTATDNKRSSNKYMSFNNQRLSPGMRNNKIGMGLCICKKLCGEIGIELFCSNSLEEINGNIPMQSATLHTLKKKNEYISDEITHTGTIMTLKFNCPLENASNEELQIFSYSETDKQSQSCFSSNDADKSSSDLRKDDRRLSKFSKYSKSKRLEEISNIKRKITNDNEQENGSFNSSGEYSSEFFKSNKLKIQLMPMNNSEEDQSETQIISNDHLYNLDFRNLDYAKSIENPKSKKVNYDLLNQASEIFTKSTLKKIQTKDSNSKILESNYNSSNLYKSKNLGLPGDSNKNMSTFLKKSYRKLSSSKSNPKFPSASIHRQRHSLSNIRHEENNLSPMKENRNRRHHSQKKKAAISMCPNLIKIALNRASGKDLPNSSINKVFLKKISKFEKNGSMQALPTSHDECFKILIIDDNRTFLDSHSKLFKDVLKAKNLYTKYKIIKLYDGIEGLYEVYNDFVSSNNKIKLIVSDQSMNFMNGSELFSMISSKFKNCCIPFLIASAFMHNEHYDYMNHLKVEYLEKPLNKGLIEMLVTKYLNQDHEKAEK